MAAARGRRRAGVCRYPADVARVAAAGRAARCVVSAPADDICKRGARRNEALPASRRDRSARCDGSHIEFQWSV